MNRWCLLPLLLAGCAGAPVQPALGHAFAVATGGDGATITLHEGRGPCLEPARAAVWASADRQAAVPGCWTAHGQAVHLIFLDGDRGVIPVAKLARVAGS